MGTNDISGPSRAVPDISAVTVTVPEPETVVFARTMENQNRSIFGAK